MMKGKDWRTGEHQKWLADRSDQAARKHVEGEKPVYSRADFDAAPEYAFEEAGLYGKHTPVTVGAGTAANDNSSAVGNGGDVKKQGDVSKPLDCLPFGITYLASPYSLYPHGFHMAARHASRAAASLMRRGLVVYCPIAMGHAIACDNDLPTTWEFWKGQCQPFIDAASACVVLKLDGWEESVGVTYEIEEFERQGKPVVYVTMDDLALPCGATVEDEWKRRAA